MSEQKNLGLDENVENWQEEKVHDISLDDEKIEINDDIEGKQQNQDQKQSKSPKIIFDGKLWTGNPRDRAPQIASIFGCLFLGFNFQQSTVNFYVEMHGYGYFSWVHTFFWILIMSLLLRCSFRDPGVIMKNYDVLGKSRALMTESSDQLETNKEQKQSETNRLSEGPSKLGAQDEQKIMKELSVDQQELILKNYGLNNNKFYVQHLDQNIDIDLYKFTLCNTCQIIKPPKTSHCSLCNQCVMLFDHHCFFIGNCVGLRNYKDFYLFLMSSGIYCFCMVVLSVTHLINLYREVSYDVLITETLDRHQIIRNIFFFWTFIFFYGLFCCHKRLFLYVQIVYYVLIIVLLGYINQWETLYYYWVVGPIIQIPFTLIALGPILGVGMQTFSNVLYGITEKEKQKINYAPQYIENYKSSIQNIVNLVAMKLPKSMVLNSKQN